MDLVEDDLVVPGVDFALASAWAVVGLVHLVREFSKRGTLLVGEQGRGCIMVRGRDVVKSVVE